VPGPPWGGCAQHLPIRGLRQPHEEVALRHK
jgi:hypothetical protein